eukprot:1418221-Amphidinium_carterae.3
MWQIAGHMLCGRRLWLYGQRGSVHERCKRKGLYSFQVAQSAREMTTLTTDAKLSDLCALLQCH